MSICWLQLLWLIFQSAVCLPIFTHLHVSRGTKGPEFRVTIYVLKLSEIFPPFPLCSGILERLFSRKPEFFRFKERYSEILYDFGMEFPDYSISKCIFFPEIIENLYGTLIWDKILSWLYWNKLTQVWWLPWC